MDTGSPASEYRLSTVSEDKEEILVLLLLVEAVT